MERRRSMVLVEVSCIHLAMELRQFLELVLVLTLVKRRIQGQLEWDIPLIKVRQELDGNYGEFPRTNTEDAHTKDRLVVLLHGDDELHRVCAVEEHLL